MIAGAAKRRMNAIGLEIEGLDIESNSEDNDDAADDAQAMHVCAFISCIWRREFDLRKHLHGEKRCAARKLNGAYLSLHF